MTPTKTILEGVFYFHYRRLTITQKEIILNEKQKKKCGNILKHFGIDSQMDKTIEELGELDEAIRVGTIEDITGEIADVEIMIEQLKQGLNIIDEVDVMIESKIIRTNRRIGGGYYNDSI